MTSASNTARSIPIGRSERIAEAGEVFTPLHVIDNILADDEVSEIIKNPDCVILEPSAGDGNFIVKVILARIDRSRSFEDNMAGLKNIWAIEIQQDNLDVLKNRVRDIFLDKSPALDSWLDTNFLCGSFITDRACNILCKDDCIDHNKLQYPDSYDLILGNPPYNPNRLYIKFIEKALKLSDMSVMILPTTWKLSSRYKKFRNKIAVHTKSWDELPWSTFSIKLRTGILKLSKYDGDDSYLSYPDYRFINSIMTKAYKTWPDMLKDYTFGDYNLYIGWKCNLQRDGSKMNMLQSLDYDDKSELLPNNLFSFRFQDEKIRRSWVLWSTTKLAAYLQQHTDSDTVCKELPFPINLEDGFDEGALYDELGLTDEEKSAIVGNDLYISGKAAQFYSRENVAIRSDAIIGQIRKACAECGSSSFHKKGCSNSTEREMTVRDS